MAVDRATSLCDPYCLTEEALIAHTVRNGPWPSARLVCVDRILNRLVVPGKPRVLDNMINYSINSNALKVK